MRVILAALLCAVLFVQEGKASEAAGMEVASPGAILMEASTGKVIYEKEADEKRAPASVTKIMTLLLIFDALEEGKISLDDEVTVSERAASMGGSQVFLEPGEVQSVETLIKCIAVASANDACVAMAEYINGSEEEFVKNMNARAAGLGMKNTQFVNCNGLDAQGHLTTPRDIALMSKELITRYPQAEDYARIWMDTITHTTAKGTSEFGLVNTNKLIRQYAYATGLKTGSTGDAGFCVSATAEKNQMELIAVVMGAESSRDRFRDASALLDYGFGRCVKYIDEGIETLDPVKVTGGQQDAVAVGQKAPFSYIDIAGADLSKIEKEYRPAGELKAPVKAGEKAGEVVYLLNGQKLGSVPIVTLEPAERATCRSVLEDLLERFCVAKQAG